MRILPLLALSLAASLALAAPEPNPQKPTPLTSTTGGVNSPEPLPPQKLILERLEIQAQDFSIEVPTGTYQAPKEGAPNYSVPAPIVRLKGPDGLWRGHGYLETYPRLLKFTGTKEATSAKLLYEFEDNKSYEVTLTPKGPGIEISETSNLGPRNLWVLDFFYSEDPKKPWAPSAGLALNAQRATVASLYLPCFYDRPEVTVNLAKRPDPADTRIPPTGIAVFSGEASSKDVIALWAIDSENWKNADAMGFQLWQRRQRGSDPASRHFLGPDTKSDSTPNPRTANLMGTSLYEGHVTAELGLGVGTRKLMLVVTPKGPTSEKLADPLITAMKPK